MQTTSRYASRTSASLGEGYSFIALRFGTCRFELQDEINNLLTNPTEEDCNDIYSHVKQKGYSFLPLIESAKKESESYERKYKELEEKNRILQDELLKTKQIIEKKDKVINQKKYENRKSLKKRKSKRQ